MSVLKLAKGLWAELETHQKSGEVIQEEMVRRTDEILKGGRVTYPSIKSVLRVAVEKARAAEKVRRSA